MYSSLQNINLCKTEGEHLLTAGANMEVGFTQCVAQQRLTRQTIVFAEYILSYANSTHGNYPSISKNSVCIIDQTWLRFAVSVVEVWEHLKYLINVQTRCITINIHITLELLEVIPRPPFLMYCLFIIILHTRQTILGSK